MREPKSVRIPQINPNEKEARLNNLCVIEGKKVNPGDLIATIESTKATLDIIADEVGFIKGLSAPVGEFVFAGEVLCFIVEDMSQTLPDVSPNTMGQVLHKEQLGDIRITKPARKLAEKAGLDISTLPPGQLITETFIQSLIHQHRAILKGIPTEKSMIVFGGGGHGKSLIELIRAGDQFDIIGIIDDGLKVGDVVLGDPVVGGTDFLRDIYDLGVKWAVNGVGGIGNLELRVRVFELLVKAGFICPAVIHPKAVCESSARIAEGAQVFALAYIGSSANIGFGCIINTGAIISHDCYIGDYSNISPGTMLAGNVIIEDKVLIGMGVTINLNVRIGTGARIGNGATVKGDVPSGGVVKAGTIWSA